MTQEHASAVGLERGRALRKKVARSAHEKLGNDHRDPIKLLQKSSEGRVPRLVPLRYGRMLASPFAFFRGSAILQAHDLAKTPHTGITQQICGDCHLMNFGGFATPERNLIFDINDFDETHPGPWEWDVKRLAASFNVAARYLGLRNVAADGSVIAALQGYQDNMARYAGMGELALWYEKISVLDTYASSTDKDARKLLSKAMEKAKVRTHDHLLPKMGHHEEGHWVMNDAPPALFHLHGKGSLLEKDDDWQRMESWKPLHEKLFKGYLKTLAPSHQHLLGRFTAQDLAFKVVGVGSVGTRCLVLLLTDAKDQPLFLQIKEASESVLSRYVPDGKCDFQHMGQRVVAGQRLMQSSSDIFLGWSSSPFGRHFYFRQLRDMKVSADIETFDEQLLHRYAHLCGSALARAHARAGGNAARIAGYLGTGTQFAEAIVAYSSACADLVDKDYSAFRKACRSGVLNAQSEADFASDVRV